MQFTSAISWFEIPAKDLDRARKFYEDIFEMEMIPIEMDTMKMYMFPIEDMKGVGGAVCEANKEFNPSATEGPLIYLNGNPDLQRVLDRVEPAGGKVLMPKTVISPEYGFMALFLDTEGNRIGLHSEPDKN